MKKLLAIIALISFLFFGFNSTKNKVTNDSVHILHQMLDSIKHVKTLRLHINAIERLGSTFSSASSEIKLRTNPRQLYFINRQKKLELLYVQNQNENKAIIKLNRLPNLHLDPTGNMMRKNQHYTIHELGFEFIGQSIALTLAKDKQGLNNFSYKGKVKKFNYNCYLIQYENLDYTYVEYTVGNKETASSIASKLVVNDYLLRYKNDLLNDFGFLKKGTVLIVPKLYCKKAVLFIEEKHMLPIAVSLYDDIGLFESYEYPHMTVNQPIKDEEFSKNNKEYHFN